MDNLNLSIIALSRLTGFNKKKIRWLLRAVDDLESLDYLSLLRQGYKTGMIQKNHPIGEFLEGYDYALKVLEECEKLGIKIVSSHSKDFPEVLRFESEPSIFYYKGDLECLANPKRATVVGTRHPDQAGKDFAYNIGSALAREGYTVISGLALGCDTAAHRGALDAGGKTVAFLPSSLSRIAPKSNEGLAQEIVDNGGLIISEFSPLSIPNSSMYIVRDKLQAGVADMVFVSEFDEQSGSLQTLDFANTYHKPIYTLKELTANPDFGGYNCLKEHEIVCAAMDFEGLEELIKGKGGPETL